MDQVCWWAFCTLRDMRTFSIVLLTGLLGGCTSVHANRDSVQVHMRNVDLHVTNDIKLRVRQMTG